MAKDEGVGGVSYGFFLVVILLIGVVMVLVVSLSSTETTVVEESDGVWGFLTATVTGITGLASAKEETKQSEQTTTQKMLDYMTGG